MNLPGPVRDLLESEALVHLVTLDAAGDPHVVVLWAGVDGNEIVLAHADPGSGKPGGWVRNLQRDPRAVISVQEYRRRNAVGSWDYVVLYGRARIEEGDAVAALRVLCRKYGAGATLGTAREGPFSGWIARIEVDRISGSGAVEP